jgi:hypothetical protein
MQTVTAKFSAGQEISRNTTKAYSHAYALTIENGSIIVDSGFASSEVAATRAAKSGMKLLGGCVHPSNRKVPNRLRGLTFEVVAI